MKCKRRSHSEHLMRVASILGKEAHKQNAVTEKTKQQKNAVTKKKRLKPF